MLSLQPADLEVDGLPIEAWTSGIPFLIVPLRDTEALARATLDLAVWRKVLSGWWAPNLYPVVRLGEGEGADWRVRMFAPGLGVLEDPATGSAATAFAGYLGRREGGAGGTLRWLIEQGIELGRPSLMHVEADRAAAEVTAIRVGGGAVLIAEGRMEVPG
jgi:trans-2,3-dihydro-3-hydroxyanthranilate isomerase